MTGQKKARITNLWSKVTDGETGAWLSKVVIESTGPFVYNMRKIGGKVVLEAGGVALNMPEGSIEANDGLLREVNIYRNEENKALVEMTLAHPAEYTAAAVEGLPFRLEVLLDRSHITGLLKGKKIVVDPGHGGKDGGGKGPVNLLEKNVVLPVAKYLEDVLKRAGANVTLTRRKDTVISPAERYGLAVRLGADAYAGIHTFSSKDSDVGGAAVLYAPGEASARLAGFVLEELIKKTRVRSRGTARQPGLAAIKGIPAIEVEVVAITNWVEEGLLRSPTVHKKAAEGIFNGLLKYFATAGLNKDKGGSA